MEATQGHNLRRECEKIHLDAISQLGLNPQDFEFEHQVRNLERHEGGWPEDRKFFFRSLERWSPSRYEIVEFIPLYYYAVNHANIACEMSHDRRQLTPLRLTVLTNPIRCLAARARDRLFDDTCLIQVDLGLVRYCEYVARALMKAVGSLSALLNVGTDEGTRNALALFDALSDFLDIPTDQSGQTVFETSAFRTMGAMDFPTGSKSHLGFGVLLQMLITFVVGHEAGHFQLGHVGAERHAEIEPLRAMLAHQGVDPRYFIEFEADQIGFLVVWDGMRNDSEFNVSIDYTALAPFIYMSAMAGYYHYVLGDPIVTRRWQQRLNTLLEALIYTMRRERFKDEKVAKLSRAIPVLSSAVTCWLGASGGTVERDHVFVLHEVTAEIARKACETRLRSGIRG